MIGCKSYRSAITAPFAAAGAALIFNGAGAIYGGLSLILRPDGSGIGLSLTLLRSSGFTDYRMPGIILLVTNGLIDFAVLGVLLFRARYYYLFVAAQGMLLLAWLIVEVAMLRTLSQMHFIMALTAVVLITCGAVLASHKKTAS